MKKFFLIFIVTFLFFSSVSKSKVWTVSSYGEFKFCSEVAPLVEDNDTVFIVSSRYEDDIQVTWTKNDLYICGTNGTPILIAGNKLATNYNNGKGIFVIQGKNTIVENIEFRDAVVPDHNGAGIRQEGANLIVRNCTFRNNEMGILQGGTIDGCTILIEICEFIGNGSTSNPGYQHNIYINFIDTLVFRFNKTYDAVAEGHELKSRAKYNFIEYNLISNRNTSDSRNIDLPNGGCAVILGNIIEQGQNSANSNIIGFGLEGLSNPSPHNLYICSNTIVNYKDRGIFIDVSDIDTLFLKNNICVGAKTGGFITGNFSFLDSSNNLVNDNIDEAGFALNSIMEYNLKENSPAINAGINLNQNVLGHSLKPKYEYSYYNFFKERFVDDTLDIGAIEYKAASSVFFQKDDDFKMYPNPANDFLEIFFKSSTPFEEIFVYDCLSNKVSVNQPIQSSSHQRIDISDL
ncbi:MAG TPA: hypothetical protein PKY56_07910, partial [Candidatus Kapabacteria bacterium]|nr:hypothetical protein [Candidatus Kapabacteria bacterium]